MAFLDKYRYSSNFEPSSTKEIEDNYTRDRIEQLQDDIYKYERQKYDFIPKYSCYYEIIPVVSTTKNVIYKLIKYNDIERNMLAGIVGFYNSEQEALDKSMELSQDEVDEQDQAREMHKKRYDTFIDQAQAELDMLLKNAK